MTVERWAILRGGPRDGAREPILGVPSELIYDSAVYRHLHPTWDEMPEAVSV